MSCCRVGTNFPSLFALGLAALVLQGDAEAQDVAEVSGVSPKLMLVTTSGNGGEASGPSFSPALSADGAVLAFRTLDADLCPGSADLETQLCVYNASDSKTTVLCLPQNEGLLHSMIVPPAMTSDGGLLGVRLCRVNTTEMPRLSYIAAIGSSATGQWEIVDPRRIGLGDIDGFAPLFLSDDANRLLVRVVGRQAKGAGYVLLSRNLRGSWSARYVSTRDNVRSVVMAGCGSRLVLLESTPSEQEARFRLTVTSLDEDQQSDKSCLIAADVVPGVVLSRNGAYAVLGVENPEDVGYWNIVEIKMSEMAVASLRIPSGNELPCSVTEVGVSNDGNIIVFAGTCGTGVTNVYRYRVDTRVVQCVSQNDANMANAACSAVALSADGAVIAFQSAADNLGARDEDGESDIYLWTEAGSSR